MRVIQHFRSMWNRIQIYGFNDQNCRILQLKKIQLQLFKFSPPWRTSKLLTRAAFSPQMRTSGTSKHEFYSFLLFSIFASNFCPPGSGPRATKIHADPIRLWIHSTTLAKSSVRFSHRTFPSLFDSGADNQKTICVRRIQHTKASSYKTRRTVTATKEELLAGSHLGVEMVPLHQVPAGANLLLQLTDVTLNK